MVWWRGDRIPGHCITCIRELKQRQKNIKSFYIIKINKNAISQDKQC